MPLGHGNVRTWPDDFKMLDTMSRVNHVPFVSSLSALGNVGRAPAPRLPLYGSEDRVIAEPLRSRVRTPDAFDAHPFGRFSRSYASDAHSQRRAASNGRYSLNGPFGLAAW